MRLTTPHISTSGRAPQWFVFSVSSSLAAMPATSLAPMLPSSPYSVWASRMAPSASLHIMGGFKSVHDRHLAVHENGSVSLALDLIDGFRGVVAHVDLHAGTRQHINCQLLVDCIVFHQQSPQTVERLHSRVRASGSWKSPAGVLPTRGFRLIASATRRQSRSAFKRACATAAWPDALQ